MKRTMKRVLSICLALILVVGTAAFAFAASVGQVKSVSVASRTASSVKLQWKAVSDADGYCVEVYNAKKKTWGADGYTTALEYTDKDLAAGTAYTYRVKAFTVSNGQRSYGEASKSVETFTLPATVSNVRVVSSSAKSVKLKWATAKGAASYVLYQSASENKGYKKVAETKDKTYTVKYTYSPGVVYFKVKSIAKVGDKTKAGELSSSFKVNLKPGAVGSISAAQSTNSTVTLTWSACTGAYGYRVLRKDAGTNKQYVLAGTTTKTTYKVKYPAAPGTAYFKVQAVSKYKGKVNVSAASGSLKMKFKPEKVSALTLRKAGPTSLTLAWNAADGASNYQLYMRNSETRQYEQIADVKKTAYTVTGLQPATAYRFAIKAVAAYEGNVQITGYSPVLEVSTVFGSFENVGFTLDSSNKLYITWDPVKGAEGYIIERSLDLGETWKQIGDVKTTLFNASSVEKDKVLQKGVKYQYRLRAYCTDNGAKMYNEYSRVLEAHPIPDAPKITRTATGSDHSVVVEWQKVSAADTYEVFYLSHDDGEWKSYLVTAGNEYTNDKGEEIVYFVDAGLTQSGSYQYKVRGVVLNDGKMNYGPFSNTVTHQYNYSAEPDPGYDEGVAASGILGYLYDPQEGCYYTASDPWQRNFGFNQLYDTSSQFVMIQYDTVRLKFTCHNGEKWMIQPWKGQYGMVLYGGEVGVYKQYSDREAEHYDCAKDEDLLMMSMSFYKYDQDTKTWEHVFDRPYASYWWCTGFVLGFIRFRSPLEAQGFSNYPDLKMDVRITMKDFDMLRGFKAALEAEKHISNLKIDNLDVYFTYQ